MPWVNSFVTMSSPVLSPPADAEEPAAPAQGARSRALAIVAACTIAVHAVLAWLVRAPTIGTGNDDAVYLLLARALREGHYRELFYVGTPIHSQYPPGYPSLLALLGVPLDGDIALVIAVNIVFSCAALGLLYDVVRRWSAPLATAAVAVLAVNPSLVLSASRVQSEPMFMAALMLALWALRPSAGERHRWVAIAAVVVAALTRSAGLAVVAAVFVHFVLDRAWRHAAALAVISVLAIAPWLVWTAVAPQQVAGRSYVADVLLTVPPRDSAGVPILSPRAADADERSPLEGLARTLQVRLSFNAKHYVTRALPARLAVPTVANTPVDNAAWLAVMLIAAGVGVAAAWSRWRAAVLALLVYALLLVLWPYAVSRFLIPMFPAFVALLLLGAWRIGVRVLPRAALVPALGVAAILLVGGTRATASMLGAHDACAPAERDEGELCADVASRYAAAAHQVDAIVAGDAPVFTTKEGTFYYLTGRRVVSVYPAVGLPSDSLAGYLRGRGVPLIFLPHLKNDEEELGEPLAEICASLTDAGSTGDDMLILHVRPPSVGEQNACAAVARWQATW
jgi:4-amino-4-deoxy-L-arabinose transferase-like glycosyltransferase